MGLVDVKEVLKSLEDLRLQMFDAVEARGVEKAIKYLKRAYSIEE